MSGALPGGNQQDRAASNGVAYEYRRHRPIPLVYHRVGRCRRMRENRGRLTAILAKAVDASWRTANGGRVLLRCARADWSKHPPDLAYIS